MDRHLKCCFGIPHDVCLKKRNPPPDPYSLLSPLAVARPSVVSRTGERRLVLFWCQSGRLLENIYIPPDICSLSSQPVKRRSQTFAASQDGAIRICPSSYQPVVILATKMHAWAPHFPFFLKTVLALAESAPHSRCFPVMSLGFPTRGFSDSSSSDPSAGASREPLSVWSSPDDSDSVHGSDDKYYGVSGCGETGD